MARRKPLALVTGGAGFLGSHLCERLLSEGCPKRCCPDITRAGEVLGREPRVPAREGLKKTLDWFAERLVQRK